RRLAVDAERQDRPYRPGAPDSRRPDVHRFHHRRSSARRSRRNPRRDLVRYPRPSRHRSRRKLLRPRRSLPPRHTSRLAVAHCLRSRNPRPHPLRLADDRPARAPPLAVSPLPAGGRAGDGRGAGVRALLGEAADRPAPLSFAQQRLWFLAQLDPASAVYNLPAAVDLHGDLDASALTAALREIVRRHETLRTTFQVVGAEPVQIVGSGDDFQLPMVDLSAVGDRAGAEAERLTAEDAVRPFDLQRGPVFRPLLLRTAVDRHRLLATMHHIVSDGWSIGLFIRELAVFYETGALPDLPVQYSDFALWQRRRLTGDALEHDLVFWRGELAGLPPGLELPTDRPRPPVQTLRGATRSVALRSNTAAGLRHLARAEGATLFMILLAGFQMLLSRLSGQDDLAVGTPVAGRTRTELEDLIGFFVNTLVQRAEMTDDPAFRTLLGRTASVL